MGSIFDDVEIIVLGEVLQRAQINRMPREMHRHDYLGAWRNLLCHFGRIDIQSFRIDIREYRGGAHMLNNIHRGGECHWRSDDLITRPDPQSGKRKMQSGSTGVES